MPMKIILVLLFLFLNANSQFQLTVPSQNYTTRYKNIYFPVKQAVYVQGVIFPRNYLVTPKTFLSNLKDSLDLCQDTYKKLAELDPSLWNNTFVSNPCERFFCSSEKNKLGNYTQGLVNLDDLFSNSDVLYSLTHQLCTRCEKTVGERFDLTLETKNCTWYRKDSCKNFCSASYECFHFSSLHSLCYSNQTRTFYSKDDFVGAIWIRHYALNYLYLIPNLIYLTLNIFLLLLPELGHIYRNWNLLPKLKMIFSLRNQSLAAELLTNIIYIILGILDALNFYVGQFYVIALYLHFVLIVFSWSMLILLWSHIYNQTDASDIDDLSTIHRILWFVIVITIVVIVGIVLIVFLLIFVLTRGVNRPFEISIVFMIILILLAVLISVVSIFLIYYSLKLYTIIRNETSGDFVSAFKMKLTRNIFIFNFILAPTLVIVIISAIQTVWIDIIGLEGIIVIGILSALVTNCFSILTILTLVHDDNLKKFYCKN